MILPSNDECQRVVKELDGEPELSEWEQEFIESNQHRTEFSDAQKQVIGKLLRKFQI